MTERFTEIISTQKVIDNQTGKEYDCLIDDDLLELLNELHEQIQSKDKVLHLAANKIENLLEENEQLKTQLDYIQNSITEHIKHQKTELGQKALKEIIEDYNEWMLGHKELEE